MKHPSPAQAGFRRDLKLILAAAGMKGVKFDLSDDSRFIVILSHIVRKLFKKCARGILGPFPLAYQGGWGRGGICIFNTTTRKAISLVQTIWKVHIAVSKYSEAASLKVHPPACHCGCYCCPLHSSSCSWQRIWSLYIQPWWTWSRIVIGMIDVTPVTPNKKACNCKIHATIMYNMFATTVGYI